MNIWTKPAQRIQSIIEKNVNHRFFLITFCYGLSFLLSLKFISLTQFKISLSPLNLLLALILSCPIGYVVFNITTFLIHISAKLMKGQAKFKEVRAAIAWSNIPGLVSSFIVLIPIIYLGGKPTFSGICLKIPQLTAIPSFLFSLTQITLTLWGMVLYVITLKTVEKFSLLKTFLTLLLATIFSLLISLAITLPVIFLLKPQ